MPLSKTVGIKAGSLYRYLLVSFIYLHDYNLVFLFFASDEWIISRLTSRNVRILSLL